MLKRINTGWLAVPERRVIAWMGPRLPLWVSPDLLSVVGFMGAVLCCIAYLLVPHELTWLWLSTFGLALNWFGDSLDGAVARLRGIERPQYGFFLDQSLDVLGQFLFAIGFGCSGLISLHIAALGFATYLMMTVQSLLRAEVTRHFHLASGGMGLTEVRCLFVFANMLFYFVPADEISLSSFSMRYGDWLGLIWIGINLALYVVNFFRQLKILRVSAIRKCGRHASE